MVNIYSNMLRQLFIAVSIFARDRRLIDVPSPLAIRIILFRLDTLITFLTRRPIVAAKMRRRRIALPTIDIGGRVFCSASTPPHDNKRQGTTTSTIYIRGTRNERSGQPYYYRLFAVRASVIMILFLWT